MMMKKNIRLPSAAPQLVRDALSSKLMLAFVIACGTYYALMLISLVPVAIAFIIFQRAIMKNLSTGGLKG